MNWHGMIKKDQLNSETLIGTYSDGVSCTKSLHLLAATETSITKMVVIVLYHFKSQPPLRSTCYRCCKCRSCMASLAFSFVVCLFSVASVALCHRYRQTTCRFFCICILSSGDAPVLSVVTYYNRTDLQKLYFVLLQKKISTW